MPDNDSANHVVTNAAHEQERLLASILASLFVDSHDAERAEERANTAHRPPPVTSGDVLGGRYHVGPPLGSGGTADVFEANDKHTGMHVAVKVFRCQLTALDRSLEYAQAEFLAAVRLSHPGVARFYGGGLASSGEPYLVSELVDGPDIVTYCSSSGLGTREIINIVCGVCDAIQYAYQHERLAHCDLKPANILVDSSGRPKVVDFGLARACKADFALHGSDVTKRIPLVGLSPRYASPEQLRRFLGDNSVAIGSRSDVFSLGLVLYELLSGVSPFAANGSLEHVELDARLKSSPAVPLLRGATAKRHTAARCAGVPALPRRHTMDGALESIVARALEYQPELRYQTAGRFADDLRAWLGGMPLSVSRYPRLVRSRRLLKRVVPWILMVATLASVSAYEIQRRLQVRRAESRHAEQALREMFVQQDWGSSQIEPGSSLDTWGRRRVALTKSLQWYRRNFATPQESAAAADEVAWLCARAGLTAEGLELLRSALDRANSAGLHDSLFVVGLLRTQAQIQCCAGLHDEASSSMQDGHEIIKAMGLIRSSHEARHLAQFGRWRAEANDDDLARQYLIEAIGLFSSLGMSQDVDALLAKCELARVETRSKHFESAEAMINECLAETRGTWGNDHPFVLWLLAQSADIERSQHDWPKAITTFERVVKGFETVGMANSKRMLDIRFGYGCVLYEMGQYRASEVQLLLARGLLDLYPASERSTPIVLQLALCSKYSRLPRHRVRFNQESRTLLSGGTLSPLKSGELEELLVSARDDAPTGPMTDDVADVEFTRDEMVVLYRNGRVTHQPIPSTPARPPGPNK